MTLSLKLGLRTLARNFPLASINLLGLAVAMAAAYVIALFVLEESGYDRWIPHADDIVLAATTWHLPGREPVRWGLGPNPLKSLVEKKYPEVEAATRLFSRDVTFRAGDALPPRFARVAFVDANFFDFFRMPARAGTPAAALADLRSLVLTESAALRLLGTKDAVGQTLRVTIAGREHDYRVAAVLADLPPNTHFSSQIFARLEEADFREPNTFGSWGNVGPLIYLRLAPGTDRADLTARLNRDVDRELKAQFGEDVPISVEMSLLPLPRLHFAARTYRAISQKPPGDPVLLLALSLIALLILAMAVANYVNLGTAIVMRRTRELALRRIFGASRRELARGYLAESILTAAVAGLLAIVVLDLALPHLGDLFGSEVTVASIWSLRGLLLIAGITVLTGLAAGIYPMLLMARFRSTRLLADSTGSGGHGGHWLRIGFILLQFATSVGLIASTTVIFGQARHLRQANLGYDPEGMIVVWNLGLEQVKRGRRTFLERLSALPGVTAAAMSWSAPGATSGVKSLALRYTRDGQPLELAVESVDVDFGFFETLGVEPLAGRLLMRDVAADDAAGAPEAERPVNILLNAAAARAFGFRDPQQAIGKDLRSTLGKTILHVVGVVPDLRFGPALAALPRPTVYLHQPDGFRLALIRYRGSAPAQAMKAIEELWREMFPDVPFGAFHVSERLTALTLSERRQGSVLAAFAALAIILAAVGIYGIAAYSAQRRAREMALRRVFGASFARLLNRVLGQYLGLVAIGGLIGMAVAFLANARWLARYPEHIAHTPTPYLVALGLAALVALGAVANEAVRVARTHPAIALREE